MKRLEAQHLPGDPLDETMVLFKDIAEVFDLQDFNRFACAGNFRIAFIACAPPKFAPLLSTTILCRTPLLVIAFLKKRRAAPIVLADNLPRIGNTQQIHSSWCAMI